MKAELIALVKFKAYSLALLSKRIFSRPISPNLLIIAQNDVRWEVRSYHGKVFENSKNKQLTSLFQFHGSWEIKVIVLI